MALQHYPRIMNPPAPAPPIVILDTNVVLDWLVFHNPECATVQTSVAAGHVHWVATTAMRDELTQVLARGDLDAWNPDLPALWAHWERHCIEVPAPAPCRPTSRWRCTDADDQKFIDLAVACGARWLLSRDRAVLKLARRLHEIGIEVTTPGAWVARSAAD